MAEKISDILKEFNEINIVQEISGLACLFQVTGKVFLMETTSTADMDSIIYVYLYNDDGVGIPHVSLSPDKPITTDVCPKGQFRKLCLYESESIVFSLYSYKEKVRDAVNRVILLMTMGKSKREKEFQKEFPAYWNRAVQSIAGELFLNQDKNFCGLEVYANGKGDYRFVENGVSFRKGNPKDKKNFWCRHHEIEAYFIPLTDSRGILPPHQGYKWEISTIRSILYGNQVSHISNKTFCQIRNVTVKVQKVLLVFQLTIGEVKVLFAVKVHCKNSAGRTLFEKACLGADSIELCKISRVDYAYLCEQIGNDVENIHKKVLLIGCGSLGSYMATELVKNGFINLTICDGDHLEAVNTLRWASSNEFINSKEFMPKVLYLKNKLEEIHPQINVAVISKMIQSSELVGLSSGMDVIISTIGSSDMQLSYNRVLKKLNFPKPVFYIWLEAGGIYGHALYVNYTDGGCFECLFHKWDGTLINNWANKNSIMMNANGILHNGCEGTRASYGTISIQRTIAATLELMKKVMAHKIYISTLVDTSPTSVVTSPVQSMRGCVCHAAESN